MTDTIAGITASFRSSVPPPNPLSTPTSYRDSVTTQRLKESHRNTCSGSYAVVRSGPLRRGRAFSEDLVDGFTEKSCLRTETSRSALSILVTNASAPVVFIISVIAGPSCIVRNTSLVDGEMRFICKAA